MDPYHNQRDARHHLSSRTNSGRLGDTTSGVSGGEHASENPDRDANDSGNPQATDRQPRYSDGFTMIPPNESRRNKMKMMAQREEEDLQRWKEANRVPSVHLNPEKLGGNKTLAEARQRQLTELQSAKLQKKLKREELDKRRRQEEEEELQKMKTEKREMAERLEERRRQEEQRRREQFRQDHLRTTERFLQRFDRRAPGPLASSSATHTSSRSEAGKQREESKSVREVQLEHQRVNSAFLDKLEGRGRGREKESKEESFQEASEDFRHQSNILGQTLPLTHLDPDPEQGCTHWTEEIDPEADYDWALMKLINSFPDCSKVFLEDILDQCNGDYKQAYTLLIRTLS